MKKTCKAIFSLALALVLVLCALLLRWLKTRGARIFAAL